MISVSRSSIRPVRLGVSALSALALLVPALLAGCGGGGSGSGGGGGQTTYTLTVNSANPASGVVIGYSGGSGGDNPAQTGTTTFTITGNSGATINLVAPQTAPNGNGFSSWSGCTSTSSNSCTVTLNGNTSVTANYATASPTVYTLTVASSNPANGVSISASPADNNSVASGTSSFTLSYNSGTSVTLTAPGTSNGNTFSSWSGCTSTTGDTCTITVNANTTVTANYTTPVTPTYTLTVNSSDPASGVAITASPADNNSVASGNSSFSLTYNAGTSVTLTAPAAAGGNNFSSWTGCTTTSGDTCTVTNLSANTTVTANYSTPATPTYTLTVNTGGATIGVSPTAISSSGTNPLTLTFDAGTAVTLTAAASAGGNAFSSWSGCASTSGDTCTVTLNANTTVTASYAASTVYALNVHVTDPTSGVTVTIADTPADNNNITNAAAPVTLRYNSGKSITLTAPASDSAGNTFSAWSGCSSTSGTNGVTCTVSNINANGTVTATYVVPTPTVTVTPATGSNVSIGQSQQFTANVQNLKSTAVTWSVAVASGSGSAGTISSSGVYQTPYPAPTSVTITATSTANTSVTGSVTINLVTPATAAGPALSVDAATVTRLISPLIYGMNAYLLDSATAKSANITVARWGGDDTSRYNYQTNVTNSANDYYFENFTGSSGMLTSTAPAASTGKFNDFITESNKLGIASIGTAPVNGWVSNSKTGAGACSFPKSADPNQQEYNSDNCGNGVDSSGTQLTGNATIAAITSISEPPPTAPGAGNATTSWAQATWTGGWVNCLITTGSYCATAGGKDVTIWDLDNEPEYWSAVHRDVHPNPMTYDEITNGGIGISLAIKTVDPNAQVSGPIISGWYDYFYSQQDVNNGYSTGPCYEPWSDPADRTAHGGVPLIEYYLQQMAAASTTYGMRLLDYVDIHAYYAANYNGASVAFTTAGDTGEQQARMNSTRVFWDPTYTDPALPQPNYTTDSNYETTSCTPPPQQGPAVIPMLESWVAKDYPGTKTSIDEYNFGGTESINGAVTQADVLGIFGKYGLDMGVFWPTSSYAGQGPGNMAFAIYRNYDGNDSTFGDSELQSNTGDQSQLAIYAGVRSSDNAVTIVVINKAYGPLTSTLSVNNLTGSPTSAQVYQYSNANLNAIVAQPATTITPPASGSTASTLSATFPGQSITLFVIPQ